MAYAMTKQGSLDNCVTYEFICDTVEDMNAIENKYRTLGSVAVVLQGSVGLEIYIANGNEEWLSLGGMQSQDSNSSDDSNSSNNNNQSSEETSYTIIGFPQYITLEDEDITSRMQDMEITNNAISGKVLCDGSSVWPLLWMNTKPTNWYTYETGEGMAIFTKLVSLDENYEIVFATVEPITESLIKVYFNNQVDHLYLLNMTEEVINDMYTLSTTNEWNTYIEEHASEIYDLSNVQYVESFD